eukprot:CAMPEP_0194315532 /NCGR_PEP_ID=MMETSP0171-20130528/12349_1 /TAXON_ID=218684 /ORGANISM="Corethron pennatum, Strain L29A3" /LENGTH=66 /DNA_ID=CAMNT_0039071389 /DNA_START=481 /DNA_END=681 /DNA_ORIENTATION=+
MTASMPDGPSSFDTIKARVELPLQLLDHGSGWARARCGWTKEVKSDEGAHEHFRLHDDAAGFDTAN